MKYYLCLMLALVWVGCDRAPLEDADPRLIPFETIQTDIQDEGWIYFVSRFARVRSIFHGSRRFLRRDAAHRATRGQRPTDDSKKATQIRGKSDQIGLSE